MSLPELLQQGTEMVPAALAFGAIMGLIEVSKALVALMQKHRNGSSSAPSTDAQLKIMQVMQDRNQQEMQRSIDSICKKIESGFDDIGRKLDQTNEYLSRKW